MLCGAWNGFGEEKKTSHQFQTSYGAVSKKERIWPKLDGLRGKEGISLGSSQDTVRVALKQLERLLNYVSMSFFLLYWETHLLACCISTCFFSASTCPKICFPQSICFHVLRLQHLLVNILNKRKLHVKLKPMCSMKLAKKLQVWMAAAVTHAV